MQIFCEFLTDDYLINVNIRKICFAVAFFIFSSTLFVMKFKESRKLQGPLGPFGLNSHFPTGPSSILEPRDQEIAEFCVG